jgi:hypothetical protein
VAQGSILGPILYFMYLYYAPAKEVGVDVALFADNAALFTSNIKCKQNHVKISAYSNQNR